jgi:hypothetical protein
MWLFGLLRIEGHYLRLVRLSAVPDRAMSLCNVIREAISLKITALHAMKCKEL